jgi:predicted CxxxxCH...CXXCH cytochrome family protein
MLEVLARPDHAAFASPEERALLASWVNSGSSRAGSGLHGPSFVDPRAPSSHGALLRAKGYAPMLDANDPDACGACHEDAPRRGSIARAAPGAPSCTSCHSGNDGPLGCPTCHGSADRAYPPRDRCFFPGAPEDRAHGAHAAPSASRSTGLACSTCHPQPLPGQIGGTHANGYVDVWFDYALAGREARFDPAAERCSGTCHDRGGARPTPAWREGAMTCNDCHSSPPAGHYAGPCTTCHHEADATGTKLTNPVLHVNGRVDLGDGSGLCGACHGQGADPWPTTGAHQAHAHPASARPVGCETCHDVPVPGEAHPKGGDAVVKLGLMATKSGHRPSYDPSTKTCNDTYCHQASGGARSAPQWSDGPSAAQCTSCHSAPPPPPHTQSATCGGTGCHEGSTQGLALTPAGSAAHVDGLITRGL